MADTVSSAGRSSPSVPSNLSMSQTATWAQQQSLSDSRGSSPMPVLSQANQQSYGVSSTNAILTPPASAGNMNSLNNDMLGGLQLGINGRDDSSKSAFASGSMDDNQFLVPISNPRSRSKSDTNMSRPSWQMGPGFDLQGQSSSIPVTTQDQQPQQLQTPQLSHLPASFGPPANDNLSSSFGNSSEALTGSINNNFLSPDHALSGVGASDLRRARSEGHGHKRNALSTGMTPIFADQSTSFLYPSQANFRFGGASNDNNYLTAGGMNASVPSAAGAHRRTMSGGSGHGHSRSLSRERASLGTSPYPSPHASPRASTQTLPDPYGSYPGGSGYGSGSGAPTVHVMSHDSQGRPTVQSQQPIQVARQNVTTHATADASMRRRRTDANFACPVPGCGSTFTRHFNLKGVFLLLALIAQWLMGRMSGHMRSHNEERPFKCHWPGCDKGFARQHDCKRHEQLHQNIRPYTCHGCARTFARMDALNRHCESFHPSHPSFRVNF